MWRFIKEFLGKVGKVPLCNERADRAPCFLGKCFILCWRCTSIIGSIGERNGILSRKKLPRLQFAGGYELCGRDIRNAVVDACVAARRNGISRLTQSCLVEAVRAEQRRQRDVLNAEDHSAVKLEQGFTEVPR